ncbi:probable transcriptional regulator protein, GntR family protein [Roseibium aggregatum IAM 12614]|uniref:Probable transcriptional regulator protein, GntR family protein n=1 Tax=Roseibium aggregatum (strain ATCC 25650 / DSM 13394 / JCM 20685 / NBRC 16684 / NCIMB 2208 / IAM 12614 / B1) TaxID=384765 RepID=A0NP21_ROSAI|nr:PLP-dependent aminotransferase family protein [Roseibium aggregatum]EAV45184.1 probable transcriptional regulator protein, GntR family protein [Roseibium aggregatum IAM 12614]
MTNWHPEIPEGQGPLYIRLADRIAEDIATGALGAGSKLPPQRDLAYDLGVTVGTIGRAYALIRQRGLVSGEVGRGTFVLGSTYDPTLEEDTKPDLDRPTHQTNGSVAQNISASSWTQGAMHVPKDVAFGGTRVMVPSPEAIRFDSTSAPEIGQAAVIGRLTADITREAPYEIASYTRSVPESWRQAGRIWLSRAGWQPPEGSIVPTTGAQAAIMAIIAATTAPGDQVAFEELTYSSIARGAALSGRRPVQIARDDEGPLPEDLVRVCAQKHPKLLFVMPTMHNPTLGMMGEQRRADIVTIARQYNLWIIEDEVYGSLRETSPPPLAALAPERTFHVGSLSKSVTAGVRGGWVSSPLSHAQRIYTAHKMLTGGISFLLSELSTRLVLSGAADEIRGKILAEVSARFELVQKYLGAYDMCAAADAPFLWLKVPEPWLSGTFKAAAAAANVLVDDEDEFKTGRSGKVYHRVRIGITNPMTRAETAKGLLILQNLLEDSGACYDSFE